MWVFTSFFAAAFQCPLPQAWMVLNSKCFDQVSNPTTQMHLFYVVMLLIEITECFLDLLRRFKHL